MKKPEPHITVQDLTMAYGDFVVMHDLTFTINRGDVFIIMGGSGCGKSTMMTILTGLKTGTPAPPGAAPPVAAAPASAPLPPSPPAERG